MAKTIIGRMAAILSLDSKQFSKGMRGSQKQVGGLSKGVKKLGLTLGVAFGGREVVRGMTRMIGLASDASEAASKFNTILGNAADDTRGKLDQFASEVGRSRYELQSMAGDLSALIKPMGFSERETGSLSVGLTKLATDLASFNNVAESDALTALRAGLVGESEPLRKFGVQLSAARIQQEAFASGLARTKSEMTPMVKAQAAYNLIMKDTAIAQGDAARTSDGLANQIKKLEGAWHDLSVEVGGLAATPTTWLAQNLSSYVGAASAIKGMHGWGTTGKVVGMDLLSWFDIEEFVNPSSNGISPQMQRVINSADAKANRPMAVTKGIDAAKRRMSDTAASDTKRRMALNERNRQFSGRVKLAEMLGLDGVAATQGKLDKWSFYNPLKSITDAVGSATDISGLTKSLVGSVFNGGASQASRGRDSAGAYARGTAAEYANRVAARGGRGNDTEKKTEANTGKTYRSVDKLADIIKNMNGSDAVTVVAF